MPITELWAYVSRDINGRETLCATKQGGVLALMLGTSLHDMQRFASAVARLDRLGNPPHLKRFSLNIEPQDFADTAQIEALSLRLKLPPDHDRPLPVDEVYLNRI